MRVPKINNRTCSKPCSMKNIRGNDDITDANNEVFSPSPSK